MTTPEPARTIVSPVTGLSPRRFVRYSVLIGIAAFSLGYVLLALLFTVPGNGQPRLCVDLSDSGTVLSDARCAGALERRYGVGAGSRVNLAEMSPSQRVALLWPRPDGFVALPFAGVAQQVELSPARLAPDPIMTTLLYARIFVLMLCLIVAGSLVAVRPSLMSWAFYLFIAFSAPASGAHAVLALWNPRLAIAGVMLWQILMMLAAVAFLEFVLRFPDDAAGRLSKLERLTPLIFVGAAFVAIMPSESFFIAGRPANAWTVASEIALAAIFGLALGTIVTKYVNATGVDRQKLAFVLWCLLVGFTGFIADAFFGAFNFPGWLARLVGLFTIVVPIGVAYAILRHRVIDVRIIISHTLMYSGVVAVVVLLFSIVENVLGTLYHEGATSTGLRFVLFIIGVATAVALFFAHGHAMRLIERCIFRSRLAAEQRMALLSQSLPDAVSPKELAEALTRGPVDAMRLTSAAAFLRVGERRFERLASVAWKPEELEEADDGNALVTAVARMHRASHLNHALVDAACAPKDERRPEIALPLARRGKLLGFVLYGAHTNGAALDGEERGQLSALAAPATAAFTHIEAIALRARNRQLEDENARLRSRMGAITATIAIALCAIPRLSLASQGAAPDLSRVPQLARISAGYEDRATHFSGTAESHWTTLEVSGTQVIVGMLDARAPIAGNTFDVLIFNGSNRLLGTLPVPRRPLTTVYHAYLDVRYSVDREAPTTRCCRGDYVDVFVRVADGRTTIVSRAYGPPIGAGGAATTVGDTGPGLQQTSADGAGSPIVAVGLRDVRRLAFDGAGMLWASDEHSVTAVDTQSRRAVAFHTFPTPCRVVDMVAIRSGSAVALSCGAIEAISPNGTVVRISGASGSARLVSAAGALWLIDGNSACILAQRRTCTHLDDPGPAAVEESGSLIVAQSRGASTAIVRVDPGGAAPVTLASLPWQVGWLLWRGAPIVAAAGSAQPSVVRADGSVALLCTLAGPIAGVSVGGYGGQVAVLAGGQLEQLDPTGCDRLETFPALHPSAFAFSNTLLVVGYASPDLVFSGVPAGH
jgi:hypothetical protein